MSRKTAAFAVVVAIGGAFWLGQRTEAQNSQQKPSERVFEIRTYTANEGKLDELHARFRDHTTKLFEKHGMTNIGYWVPMDEPESENTLIYIVAHESHDAAMKNWAEFGKDPEWQAARAKSEENGKLVAKVERVYMTPTDYSAMK